MSFAEVAMHIQSNRFSTRVWLILTTLTIATFSIGEAGLSGKGIMLSLLAIAFIKGQLVANYFMGLRHAGWFWRGIILGYFLVVGGMIAVAYLIGLK
jgi:caa(3)-type oxidase subunit IV